MQFKTKYEREKIKEERISIVIPIHDTGIYLKECMESIFNQTYKNIEIICVNDASTDPKTLNILKCISKQPYNIKIINLEKAVGAGTARNIGFQYVSGKYTIFLDSDDVFKSCMLEKMCKELEKDNSDICICAYEYFYEDGQDKVITQQFMFEHDVVMDKTRSAWLLSIGAVPWNKLCRTKFLKENNIYFQSLSSCNDVFFSCMVNLHAKSIAIVSDEPQVMYRTNIKTQISANRNPVNIYKVVELIKKENQDYEPQEELEKYCNTLLVNGLLGELRRTQNEVLKKQAYELVKKYFETSQFKFSQSFYEQCRRRLVNSEYDEHWFDGERDFCWRLNLMKDDLCQLLKQENRVFIWGLGVHGTALQKICRQENVAITGVADIKNEHIGEETEYGFWIKSTESVMEDEGMIVCTNRKIMESLSKLTKRERLLDLEGFCSD